MIKIIVAANRDNLIGNGNSLPWHLSDDLKRFRNLTTGNTVIMGRKTYESIGKALPNRCNIVLTKDKNYKLNDALVVNSIDEIFDSNIPGDLYVIGGAQIYEQFIEISDFIYFTEVKGKHKGDIYLKLDKDYINENFKVVNIEEHDEFTYVNYERKIKYEQIEYSGRFR